MCVCVNNDCSFQINKSLIFIICKNGKMTNMLRKYFHITRTHRNLIKIRLIQTQAYEKLRNIGIIAHIDAGKTTTTERMLYYSGAIHNIGNVDDGNTVMDYMPQERDRGITINSAVITFPWKKHQINLIDTPGHVDFTLEVERSLRVIDGAVTILDASEGVEAQTITVWKQADKNSIPRLLFLNKMDKPRADLHQCLDSIKLRFPNVRPLVLQLPIGKGRDFCGVVDLIKMKKLLWDNKDSGSDFTTSDITPEELEYSNAVHQRHLLIESLADIDDVFADRYLATEEELVGADDISAAIRRNTIKCTAVPLLMGSSFKNKCVQSLLDAIVMYLPSPAVNKDTRIANEYFGDSENKASLCALAFKTIHDKRRGGAITFARVYSGSLHRGDHVYNANRKCPEKIDRLLQVSADDMKEVNEVTAGNIVAISSLKETKTGDTLLHSLTSLTKAMKKYENGQIEMSPLLGGVNVPEPVFFCSVEPASMTYQKALDHALDCLTREDPSLRCTHDQDTGQTILSGMGELHLEIIADRILKEYKLEVDLGPVQIAYRETVTHQATGQYSLDQRLGDQHHTVNAEVSVQQTHTNDSISMDEAGLGLQKHALISPGVTSMRPLTRRLVAAVDAGVRAALHRGPLIGYSTLGVQVTLDKLEVGRGTSSPMVTACIGEAVSQAMKNALPLLLEPVMRLEISTTEEYVGVVLNDLSLRGSRIGGVEAPPGGGGMGRDTQPHLTAITPLSQLLGYSSHLRTSTSGMAHFSMLPHAYEPVSQVELQRIKNRIYGR